MWCHQIHNINEKTRLCSKTSARSCKYLNFTIIFEDLETKELVHDNFLAKRILDAMWGKLVTMTQFKAESAGTEVILVDPCNTHANEF